MLVLIIAYKGGIHSKALLEIEAKMLSHILDHHESFAVSAPLYPNHYRVPPCDNSDVRTFYSNLPVQSHIIDLPTNATASNTNANITDCQYIGSYNWVSDHNDISIIVPGSPREWVERPLPFTVPPDILGHYREQYDLRMRSAPLLPLLLAVNRWHERAHSQSSKFPWHAVDFVTNRSSLRRLLRILHTDNGGNVVGTRRDKCFRHCSTRTYHSKPFRIDVELAGAKTILFSPWEPADFEPLGVNSYGFNFENAFTREASAVSNLDEAGETARHHRIVSYDFGGLQVVVGSEIDACLPISKSPTTVQPKADDTVTFTKETASQSTSPISTSFGLTIIPSPNQPTPQSHLLELSTTRSSTFRFWNAKERYPQLYFSQVPNHYLAFHIEGTIDQISKRSLHESPEILFYAPIAVPRLQLLRELLEMIQRTVIAHANRSCGMLRCFSLVYSRGCLRLYERVGDRTLPREAFAMFDI